jgi:hypothetical protein
MSFPSCSTCYFAAKLLLMPFLAVLPVIYFYEQKSKSCLRCERQIKKEKNEAVEEKATNKKT